MGFASVITLTCTAKNCKFSNRFYTSPRTNKGQAFEVNRRAVLAARNIGVAHQGLVKFAGVVNMLPPMNESCYKDHVKVCKTAGEMAANKSMETAVEETKQYYEPEEDEIHNIGISADGIWRRRGFSSVYGVVTSLSLATGKVIDIEIMSKEYRGCVNWKGKQGTNEFDEWWEGHQHLCSANFTSSSVAMDSAGVLAIFQRSIENYSLRYTESLGNGDSKAVALLTEESVYGDNAIAKLELVGHVQTRMGSLLAWRYSMGHLMH